MPAYTVKEIFYTLQGEGAQSGRPAVFCRFSGCNLWSGREEDRASAICNFCDTDFRGTDGENGGKYPSPEALAEKIASLWPGEHGKPYVVCTGGEPLLQLDETLIKALHKSGFEVAVGSNGTVEAPPGIDWICVSPKAGTDLILLSGNELKLVYPQAGAPPEKFADLPFDYFYLQPMDGPLQKENTLLTLDFCLRNPQWRMSLQTHKILDIP